MLPSVNEPFLKEPVRDDLVTFLAGVVPIGRQVKKSRGPLHADEQRP